MRPWQPDPPGHPDLAAEPGLMFRTAGSTMATVPGKQSRVLRDSLERLEHAQNELFQL